ncbi:ComF family protein [Pseudofulvibacter geojedonensis]|uniref:ComF family protein n=1 Tax=Pseudofulvibacter geojedonensis TaxID=1123758 RepID=A0ABW3I0E2_9FLAO
MYKYLINLLFPKLCVGCEDLLNGNEIFLCNKCLHLVPCTNLHTIEGSMIKDLFYGSVCLEQATALFYFHKDGIVQKLMHHLKYKGQEGISSYLGNWLGEDLKSCNAYKDIDIVIPVPLHTKKLKSRGYNQVDGFGKAIANKLKVGFVNNVLIRDKNTHTQTKKSRWKRWKNVDTIFMLDSTKTALLKGKHILLVDDIITTGSTIKACAYELLKIPNVKLSIAVMAYTE